ncbi:glutamate 5-kinase [Croceicoccus naphthovorans]|uniref:Glutamate 5-kinase n=1 Tax=Croceicoccus naphthovorans TaxID=1348774 RepID=A0A0G3XHL8_9SPHN|nr:glutamate 5-kinase [Croceicoccus naphthovorans]AKM10697.1 glutamate 5-kinase [Croceicoccus naphthovorans]MBB3992186.1 glutamate 5-kinase [Croceicoccus naphthovorans]
MTNTIATLADIARPASCARLVIKVGSALLVGPDGQPRREWLASLVQEIAEATARGQQVIVVSSGAIALGAARLGLAKGGRGSLADAQAAAAVGQIGLGGLWAELLAEHGLTGAQLLLTLDDLEDRRRYLNASATLGRLLEAGAVPVVNENDSVATQEIRFGDNDRLAARVAQAGRADAVLLLSDIDGLYDRNPKDPAATMVPVVRGVSADIHAMADGGSASGLGSGGMTSKLQAAEIAERAGIALAIINGTYTAPIGRALGSGTGDGGIGTLFLPRRRDGARKAWLGGRLKLKGVLNVDAGAAKALLSGRSLLAKGVTAVSGEFTRGDAVEVRGPDGFALAKGLAEYDAAECAAIMGRHTDDQEYLLGYAPRSAVVHRNQMVLL